MRIRSFIASTVQEALKSVKREMGDDSIILETRTIEEGDIKSREGQSLVEVVAAEYNTGKSAEENADQKDGKDVQDDRGDFNLQLPDQNMPASSQSGQQQLEQRSSNKEHNNIHEGQMGSVTLADHLHSGDLGELVESTPTDRVNSPSGTAQAGEVGQVSQWNVGNKVINSIPEESHVMKNNGGNSSFLSQAWYPSEQYSSVNKKTDLSHDQMGNITLADHLLSEDLIEMAGYSADEIPEQVVHHQNCNSNDDWTEASEKLFKQLRIQQVEEEHSRILINEVLCRLSKDEYDRMDLHFQMLRDSIIHKIKISDTSFSNKDECNTTVFIGATGTGKTSTILKLASETRKRSDKEILLISIRGNSAEKLKKTADRIGATLRTVTSHRELREIGEKYGGSSHIFIDTPGVGYLDDNALSGLKGFLDQIPNKEIHLVVCATTRYADIINIINKFSVLPIRRLLFTKVDETSLYGSLLSIAIETQIPLSCISDGQDIPEDIRQVTAEMVTDMVLQG